MGSTYTVKYVRGDGVPGPEALRVEVERILAQVDRQMSTYRDDSDLQRFNRAPAGTCMEMPEDVVRLVTLGQRLSRQSDGAYDQTLEPLLALWGFGPQGRVAHRPSPGQVAEARALTGYRHLRIEGLRMCKAVALQLDLNSIAAGHAIDRIVERLGALGVTRYMVEVTGELKAAGRKPDGSPWRIALEAPRDDRRVAQRVLAIDGQGVSTSGDYRNYYEQDGVRYSHTLDPRSGTPIQHDLAAVTVVTPSATLADGLSTVLLVLGREEGMAYAEREGIAAFFVFRQGEDFVTHSSTAFERLFGAGEEQ